MKKSVLYVFVILFTLCSCSRKDEVNNSEFLEEYFEEWGITIPYQDVSKSKTYHLLEGLTRDINKNEVNLITLPSNNTNYPYWKKFNEYLWNHNEATTLFERKDCAHILISTYLSSLKNTEKYLTDDNPWNDDFRYLVLILSSEMSMSTMNVTEKVHLMVLALESEKSVMSFSSPFEIMISIMLSNNYTPFVENVKPIGPEDGWFHGYGVILGNAHKTFDDQNDLIITYATQFINDNK